MGAAYNRNSLAVAELARGHVMAVRKPTVGAMTAQHSDDVTAHRVRRPRICFRVHVHQQVRKCVHTAITAVQSFSFVWPYGN